MSSSNSGVGNNQRNVPQGATYTNNSTRDSHFINLSVSTAANRSSSDSASSVQAQIDQSNGKLDSLADKLKSLSQQRAQYTQRASDAAARYQGLMAQKPTQAAGQSDSDYQKAVEAFNKESPSYDNDVATAKAQMDDATAQIASLDEQIRDAQQEQAAEQSRNDSLHQRLSSAEQQDATDNARQAQSNQAASQARSQASASTDNTSGASRAAATSGSASRHQRYQASFSAGGPRQDSLLPVGGEPVGTPAPARPAAATQSIDDGDDQRDDGTSGA